MSVPSPNASESDSHSQNSTLLGDEGGGEADLKWEAPGESCDESMHCEWEGWRYQVGDVVYIMARYIKVSFLISTSIHHIILSYRSQSLLASNVFLPLVFLKNFYYLPSSILFLHFLLLTHFIFSHPLLFLSCVPLTHSLCSLCLFSPHSLFPPFPLFLTTHVLVC